MKVIFSRKGFDSTSGGHPSPIMPDGRLIPLPIPEDKLGAGIPYTDLSLEGDKSFATLVHELGVETLRLKNQRMRPQDIEAHLDPDLGLWMTADQRSAEWRPLFGQSDQAQSHLANCKVAKGDLFLFFGLFRRTDSITGRLAWVGPRMHAIWGYMEIDEVHTVATAESAANLPWAKYHPHLRNWRDRKCNTIYVATSCFSLNPELPGARVLKLREDRCLTSPPPNKKVSTWTLPACLHPSSTATPLTYHRKSWRWSKPTGGFTTLQTVGRGQEFIVEATTAMQDWVRQLLQG